MYIQSTTKLFEDPSILNIFIHFFESNVHMLSGFLNVDKHKYI